MKYLFVKDGAVYSMSSASSKKVSGGEYVYRTVNSLLEFIDMIGIDIKTYITATELERKNMADEVFERVNYNPQSYGMLRKALKSYNRVEKLFEDLLLRSVTPRHTLWD